MTPPEQMPFTAGLKYDQRKCLDAVARFSLKVASSALNSGGSCMPDDANLPAPKGNAVMNVASRFIWLRHCFGAFGEAVSSHEYSFCNTALLDRRQSNSGTVFTNAHATRLAQGHFYRAHGSKAQFRQIGV